MKKINDDLGTYLYRILSIKRLLKAGHRKRLANANFAIEQATAGDAFWHSMVSGAVNSQNYEE